MPRFIRGGRGAWRKIHGSHHGGSNVGCGGAILVIFLFVADIVLFVVACSVGYFPLIFIFGAIGIIFIAGIYQGIKELKKEKNSQAKDETTEVNRPLSLTEEKEARKMDSFSLKKENIQKVKSSLPYILQLTEKYYPAIKKYVETRYTKHWEIFWNFCGKGDNEFYLLYENNENDIVKLFIKKDGFPQENDIGWLPKEEKTRSLINGLLKRIAEAREWEDNDTLHSCVYFIIRNGIVKYYYELYKSEFTYETLDDIFRNNEWEHSYFQAHIFSDLHALYTFYYAYTHDIFTPLFPLYDKTKIEIEEARSRLSQAKSENFYFDEANEEINIDLPSYSGFCKNNLTLIEKIDCMSGKEFEAFIATLFQKKGFKVSQTPLSGDFGIDVIIENSLIKIGIQTKCYNDKVSNSAVQEAVTGIKHYNLDKAMVITNNYFQPSAIALAKDNNVILWDRDKLLQEIEGE